MTWKEDPQDGTLEYVFSCNWRGLNKKYHINCLGFTIVFIVPHCRNSTVDWICSLPVVSCFLVILWQMNQTKGLELIPNVYSAFGSCSWELLICIPTRSWYKWRRASLAWKQKNKPIKKMVETLGAVKLTILYVLKKGMYWPAQQQQKTWKTTKDK